MGFDAMQPPALTAEERAIVARTWAYRAESERRAQRRFARLAMELVETDASAVVIDLTQAAVEDEARHTVLCDALALEYGWTEPLPSEVREPAPMGPPDLSLHDRVLFEMMAFCCFTETLNAAMLVQILKRIEIPNIHSAVHEILRDEVSHSRAGWAHLHDRCTDGQGAFLGELLPMMFELSEVRGIYGRDPSRDEDRLAIYGEMHDSTRIDIFRSVLQDVFFPGLEGLAIPTQAGRAWLSEVDPKHSAWR